MVTNYESFTDKDLILAYVGAHIDGERYAKEIEDLYDEMKCRYSEFLNEAMGECE